MRLSVIVVAVILCAGGCSLRGVEPPPSGSTLERTWVDPDGDGVLERGPGEPFVDRTELAPATEPGDELAVFAQLTDIQITDEESPARVELLDRVGPPFESAFRLQESLTGQVLAASLRSVAALRPQALVLTGDLVDNAQRNELDALLEIMRGGTVDPGSGAAGYDGVQSAANPDPFFYRPDVDPPRELGLLRRAQAAFSSPGTRVPWYPLVGNHDLLVQGNVAPSARIRAVATGSQKLVRLNELALGAVRAQSLSRELVEELLVRGLPGAARLVSPDPRRRPHAAPEAVERLRAASAAPAGGPLLDYSFDIGGSVRGIALDTVRRDVGAGGLLRPAQVRWLREELARAGERWVVVFSTTRLTATEGAAPALAALDASSRVIAVVSGDKHENRIEPRASRGGGYWLIGTSSLVDYPQQGRAFRLRRTADGRVVLETWLFDHAPTPLAEISRRLAFLDHQGGRPRGLAGARSDRNARLYR
ncbi:MAG: metallophosphoesterase [Gaiellaceae bacterium MAG52_C11]|nr:metallophosphoesterase [Candidatus Gaiellasilicea maunaloa]